jgi:hypothetical protein
MRTAVLLALVGLAVAMTGGCASDPLTLQERLEVMVQMNKQLQVELLDRDRRIAELGGGQAATRPQHPVGDLRPGQGAVEDPFKPVAINFNRLTAGYRGEGLRSPDAGLRVVFTPEDGHGDVVKRAGALELDLYDLALEGKDQKIGHWEFTVDQLSRDWVSGMGINTYSLKLPWQNGLPKHRELTLLARFITLDGRNLTQQTHFKVDLGEAGSEEKPAAEKTPPAGAAPASVVPAKSGEDLLEKKR